LQATFLNSAIAFYPPNIPIGIMTGAFFFPPPRS
jgi:hypothetical protein